MSSKKDAVIFELVDARLVGIDLQRIKNLSRIINDVRYVTISRKWIEDYDVEGKRVEPNLEDVFSDGDARYQVEVYKKGRDFILIYREYVR